MTAHKHAALMLQYAQDWAETDKPWGRWEFAESGNKFESLSNHPHWYEEYEYRRKPRTITYSVTIPEPMRDAPEVGEIYYVADTKTQVFYEWLYWYGDEICMRFLTRGLCFATKEDAIAAAIAMLPVKGEES